MLKLRGKRLYYGNRFVAEIRGYREWVKGEPTGGYYVVDSNGYNLGGDRGNFAYFKDAVKWAKDVLNVNIIPNSMKSV